MKILLTGGTGNVSRAAVARLPAGSDNDGEGSAAMARWECRVCMHVHDGDEPPEQCPVCGASKDEFQKVS